MHGTDIRNRELLHHAKALFRSIRSNLRVLASLVNFTLIKFRAVATKAAIHMQFDFV
jgi:hypothetical protein